jgi:hypothetical protein
MYDVLVPTEIKKYASAKEASAARKKAISMMAHLSLQGYRDNDYPSLRCGACSFDDDGFYVVFPIVDAQ